jgi:peptide/nickel transport system permease protein
MSLLLPWGAFLGRLYLSWDRMVEVFTAPRMPVDGLVAVITLGALLLGLWAWALYDLKVRAARPIRRHGDSQWAIAARHFRRNRSRWRGSS